MSEVIRVFKEIVTIKTADYGCVWVNDYKPKSVSAGWA